MSSIFHLVCSCTVCKQQITSQNINRHYDRHFKQCVVCGKQTSKNSKRFCSQSCSAKHSNAQRDYTKVKTGPKKGYTKPTTPPHTKVSLCSVCNKYHTGKGRSCSTECKRFLISLSMKNRVQNGYNPQKNRGRSKRSYLERSFNEWLTTNYPNIGYETEYPFKRQDFVKTYFADFYFPSLSLIIELDGSQHNNTKDYDAERDACIESVYGCKVVRISHKEYKAGTRIEEIKSLLNQ